MKIWPRRASGMANDSGGAPKIQRREREQQRIDRVDAIKSPEQEAFEKDPEQGNRDRRHDQRAAESDLRCYQDCDIGANRKERAVRQIDDAAERKDQRQAKRD
jgi:hypothetical protein